MSFGYLNAPRIRQVPEVSAGSRRELRSGLRWFGSATLAMRVLDLLGTVVILRYLTRLFWWCIGVTVMLSAGVVLAAPSIGRVPAFSSPGGATGSPRPCHAFVAHRPP